MAGSNWVFAASPGQVSRLYENRDNIYIVMAGETTPVGLAPLEDVTSRVSLAVKKDKQLQATERIISLSRRYKYWWKQGNPRQKTISFYREEKTYSPKEIPRRRGGHG